MSGSEPADFSYRGAIFDVEKIETELKDILPDLRILWMNSTTSTNDEARELAKLHAASWTMIVARTQTAGRGRYSRMWESPPGGLYMSILLHYPSSVSPPTLIPLLVGLALKEGIESELARLGGGAFRGWLKWPNDLVTEHGKLAGVLCEATVEEDIWEIIVGAGLNLDLDLLEGIGSADDQPLKPTALRSEYPSVNWKREDLLIAILRKLSEWLEIWQNDPVAVRKAWLDASGVEGKKVVATSMGKKIAGIATGLGDNGELLIQTKDGVHPLNAAEALTIHDDWKP